MFRFAYALSVLLLAGCATVVNGGNQDVSVATNPPGATCTVERVGAPVGIINPTPGMMSVSRSKNALDMVCTKPGYQTAATTVASSFNGWTFGNLLAGGIIGFGIDAATGANNDYPKAVNVDLAPATIPPTALRPETQPAPMGTPGV